MTYVEHQERPVFTEELSLVGKEVVMPKYLFVAKYTHVGLKGLLKDGGSKRREDLSNTVKEMNGTLESMHFSFGENDVYSIVNLPDNVSAATVALNINASGAAQVKTTVLLNPEEIDEATKIGIKYRPPGGSIV